MKSTDQTTDTTDALIVMLTPEDANTAFAAGVQFARALAGAEPASFMLALGEQEPLIRAAIVKAGFSLEKAHLAPRYSKPELATSGAGS